MYTYQEDTNTYLKIERKKRDGWIGSAVTIDTHRPLYLIGEIRKKKRKKKNSCRLEEQVECRFCFSIPPPPIFCYPL